jgi:hypothetical protein
MATHAQRVHAVTVMTEMYKYRAQLGYPPGDQRTSRDSFSWGLSESAMFTYLGKGGTIQFDCSEYVPWVLRCAGLWKWSTPGWTGSHLQLWDEADWTVYTNAKEAEPGAIVIFGPGSGHHEAVVKVQDAKRGNPVISSHGHPGLDEVPLAVEAGVQERLGFPGVRFLSIAKL